MMIRFSAGNALPALVAVVSLCAACEESTSGSIPPPFRIPPDYAFVTTSDGASGAAAIVAADTTLERRCNLTTIDRLAVARYYEGRIYVLNQDGADNVQILEPAAGFATLKRFSVGTGAGPHDIAFVSTTRAFVTRYNEDQLWIVDPNQGRRSGLIDFAWLADADLIPEMDHMLRIGNLIFVSVQRLDRNQPSLPPVGDSYIVVFDAFTEQFIDTDLFTNGIQPMKLVGTNPSGELVLNPETLDIWLPVAGSMGVNDGGLEVVDPATFDSQIVITESQLGGDIIDVVALDENRGVAIVTDATSSRLVGFDLSAPQPIDTLYAPGSDVLQDAELSRDKRIFLSDRSVGQPGIRVFNATTWTQITNTPVDVCLPPADIELGRLQ